MDIHKHKYRNKCKYYDTILNNVLHDPVWEPPKYVVEKSHWLYAGN